jgi:hypothetical protein
MITAGKPIPPARKWSSVTGWLPTLPQALEHPQLMGSASAIDRIRRWKIDPVDGSPRRRVALSEALMLRLVESSLSPCVDPLAPASTGANYHWACLAGDPPNAST